MLTAAWGNQLALAQAGGVSPYETSSGSSSASRHTVPPVDDPWPDTSLRFGRVQPGMLQDEPTNGASLDTAHRDTWQFQVIPFVWALELDGNLTVEGLDVSVDIDFGEIWDHLEFAGMLQVRAQNDRWILNFDGFYAKLSADDDVDLRSDLSVQLPFRDFALPVGVDFDISIDIDLAFAQFYLGYEVFNQVLGEHAPGATGPRLIVAPYGGVRYTYWDTKVSVRLREDVGPFVANQSFKFDQSEDWLDLVLGVDVALLNLGKFSIVGRADIGGFDIGNGSDLVWSATGLVGYDLTPNVALVVGYHVLDYDFDTGRGLNAFKLDAQLRGPVLAVRMVF
jgi:hypothetical protein